MHKTPIGTFEQDCDIYFSRLKNEPPKRPEMIILDLTHRCNLKCVMCDIAKDGFSQSQEFKTDEVLRLIDQVKEWGVPELVLSGGEPMVRSDIFRIIEYALGKVNLGILSNGTALDSAMLKKLFPYLSSGALSLTISLDGINSETHDSIRGVKSSFEKTTSALKALSRLKRSYPDINFNTISIIMNKNLEELSAIAEFVKGLGANSIQFQPLIPNNLRLEKRYQTSLWVPEKRRKILDSAIDELIDFKKKNPLWVINTIHDLELMKKYFRGNLKKEDVKCYAIFKTMLISMDGKATACNTSYGNVRKKRLIECWNSAEAENSRRRIMNCEKPCLLPCFTDSTLSSPEYIVKKMLLATKNMKHDEKEKILKSALNVLKMHSRRLERQDEN